MMTIKKPEPRSQMTTLPSALSPPRRILIVSDTWFPDINGVAHTLYNMVQEMLHDGYEVTLVRPRHTKNEQPRQYKDKSMNSLNEYLVPSLGLFWYPEIHIGLARTTSMMRLLQQVQPHLVQVVTEGILGRAALLAAKKMQIPVISEYHTNFDQYAGHYKMAWLTRLVQAYLRRLHNQADLVLVPTEELKTKLAQQGFRQLHVVSRGLDTTLFNPVKRSQTLRKKWQVGNDDLVVIYVGRVAPEKNLDLAVETFRAIQQQRQKKSLSPCHFVIVGDGPARKRLQQQNPDFIFCGMQTGEDLAQHYASADLFLAPSLSETFGNTILEAMASQLAIVCFYYASAKEHLQNGRNALPVEFGKHDTFIDAALQLSQQAILRQQLAKQARHDSAALSWQQTFVHFHQAIESLLNTASTGDIHYEVVTSLK